MCWHKIQKPNLLNVNHLLVWHNKFGTGTICKSIFGLMLKTQKHFGTCRRTRRKNVQGPGKIRFVAKDHSFCKQRLHDLQSMKARFSSPNISKVARADRSDISCQFMKTVSLCRHCLQIRMDFRNLNYNLKFN